MITVIRGTDRAKHTALFDAMYEDRKRLFVDLLGWNIPTQGAREIDEFDHEDAVYIVACDQTGAHHGSMRLLPTSRPHLLSRHFTSLCPEGVPSADTTYEITRLCLPTRLGPAQRLQIRNALISAMVDHALANGIKRLIGLVEDRFRREILAMGWLAEPLGPALLIDGALLGAFALHIAPDTPDRLSWTGIYQDTSAACEKAGAEA